MSDTGLSICGTTRLLEGFWVWECFGLRVLNMKTITEGKALGREGHFNSPEHADSNEDRGPTWMGL